MIYIFSLSVKLLYIYVKNDLCIFEDVITVYNVSMLYSVKIAIY